jgi:glycosyltransferase involved in cell wall biosynthesis
MATYNGEKYLQDQLKSFICQKRLPDELIVCDDGSTDSTIAILKKFSEEVAFKVLVIQNEQNLGVVRNFEKAISLCSGDLIFFSDQDDVWFSNKIAEVFKVFQEKGDDAQIVINDAVVVDKDLQQIKESLFQSTVMLKGRSDEFISGCCTAIRKEFMDLCLSTDAGLNMFDDGFHRIGELLGVRYVCHKPLQYYRRHGHNVSPSIATAGNLSLFSRLSYYYGKFVSFTHKQDRYDCWLLERYKEALFICDRLNEIPLFKTPTKLNTKKDRVSDYAGALKRRIYIRQKGAIRRAFLTILFYFQNGYSKFSGYKSLMLDLFK